MTTHPHRPGDAGAEGCAWAGPAARMVSPTTSAAMSATRPARTWW
jgi:hypothetical protein